VKRVVWVVVRGVVIYYLGFYHHRTFALFSRPHFTTVHAVFFVLANHAMLYRRTVILLLIYSDSEVAGTVCKVPERGGGRTRGT